MGNLIFSAVRCTFLVNNPYFLFKNNWLIKSKFPAITQMFYLVRIKIKSLFRIWSILCFFWVYHFGRWWAHLSQMQPFESKSNHFVSFSKYSSKLLRYFIAATEVIWNYLPTNYDCLRGSVMTVCLYFYSLWFTSKN